MTTRLAVISGGGTEIGVATGVALATEGFDVLLIGRQGDALRATAERIGEASGRQVTVDAVVADLIEPAEVARVVEAVAGRTVDVIVNNAGGHHDGDPTSLAGIAGQWRANFDANVLTTVLLTEALRPALRRPGGRVILLTSIPTQPGGDGPFSAASAALRGWAYSLARELGKEQITVNVINPGQMVDREYPVQETAGRESTRISRSGEPVDVAATIRYLASPDASDVTGQVFGVDAGCVLGR